MPGEENKEQTYDEAFEEALKEDNTEDIPKEEPVKKDEETQDQDKPKPTEDPEPDKEKDIDFTDFKPLPKEDLAKEVPKADESQLVSQLATANAEISKLSHKMSSWEGRIKKANERADTAEEDLKKIQETKKYTPPEDGDDEAVVKDFINEFPDLEKPIRLMAMKIAEQMISEKIGDLEPKFQKLDEKLQEDNEENEQDDKEKQEAADRATFEAPITDAHSDWKQIYESGNLQKWIDIQNDFIKDSLTRTVQQGSQEEIIKMFNAYKKSMSISEDKDEPNSGEDPDAKAQALLAVPAKPGGPTPPKPNKDDFDSAWEEALSRDKK